MLDEGIIQPRREQRGHATDQGDERVTEKEPVREKRRVALTLGDQIHGGHGTVV